MSEDKELNNFFKSHKKEINDNNFSREVMEKLPRRTGMLPYLIIAFCAAIGLYMTISIASISLLMDEMNALVISVSRMQIPSTASIITYLSILITLGTLSFAIYRVDTE
ncbi:MAG TPA: hypothetical protein DIT04_10840 [Dysgonomonas sp.]|nr:hypothetical protein [Dysgonomonas sp.]